MVVTLWLKQKSADTYQKKNVFDVNTLFVNNKARREINAHYASQIYIFSEYYFMLIKKTLYACISLV